jgi:hypothetical protein
LLNLLLISAPGASLSGGGKNYEKAQVPAFSKTEFFLRRQVIPQESARLPLQSTGAKKSSLYIYTAKIKKTV